MNYPVYHTATTQPKTQAEPAQVSPVTEKLRYDKCLFFDNDLTAEEKEEVAQVAYQSAKALLSGSRVTLNGVSRMFALDFGRVKRAATTVKSLSEFFKQVLANKQTTMDKLRYELARLSDDERAALLGSVKASDCSDE